MELHLVYILGFILSSGVVSGREITVTSCMDTNEYINKGETCDFLCTVTGLGETEYFGIDKLGATYYGIRSTPVNKEKTVVLFSDGELHSQLPDRYNASFSDNDVTITITDAQSEDIGNLTCWIKDSLGNKVDESKITSLRIIEPSITQVWGKLNENDELVEIYRENEISINRSETDRLVQIMSTAHPLAVRPRKELLMRQGDGIPVDVLFAATLRDEVEEGGLNDAGLITNFTAQLDIYKVPDSSIGLGKPTYTGRFIYADKTQESNLILNLIAPPFITYLGCTNAFNTEVGSDIEQICYVLANPESTSVALRIPGREELIYSTNPGAGFTFDTTPFTLQDWTYRISVKYHNVAAEVFGRNELVVVNSLGTLQNGYNVNDINGVKNISFSVQLTMCLLSLCYLLTKW